MHLMAFVTFRNFYSEGSHLLFTALSFWWARSSRLGKVKRENDDDHALKIHLEEDDGDHALKNYLDATPHPRT